MYFIPKSAVKYSKMYLKHTGLENDVNMTQTGRTSAAMCDRLFRAVLVELLGTHYTMKTSLLQSFSIIQTYL